MIDNNKKTYKALIVDVDGTLVNNEYGGGISERVRETIIKARDHIAFSIASGRPLERVTFIFDELQLQAPCIVSGGAQIVDPASRKVLWEQPIFPEDVALINQFLRPISQTNKIWVTNTEKETLYDVNNPIAAPLSYFIPKILLQEADALIHLLSERENVVINKVVAYHEGYIALQITHKEATKHHAIKRVTGLLGLTDEEVIGVGDGHNDFPLFEACGFRVAVGNAIDDLKEKADYIAPSVADDGVAHVIEKFVFNNA